MQFIKKLFVYFVGTVFNKLIIFILLPIYTRYLSPTDYGNADLSITTVTMLTSLLFMEVWTPLLRFSYDCKTKDEKKKVYFNAVIVALACLPVFILGCVAFIVWQDLSYAIWMILYGLSLLILHMVQFEVRAIGNSTDFMISGMISSVLQLIISFTAIYGFSVGAEIVVLSPTVSNFFASLYLEFKYKFTFSLKKSYYSSDLVKKIVKYSFPLAINAVAFWGMTNINRYFSRAYLGAEYNGYIALATKFIALVNTLVQIFALAWQESAYENSNSAKRAKYYSDMLVMYLDVMSVGTAVLIVATNIVFPYFIGGDYDKTQLILPIYYISALVSALSNFYGHIFNAEKKTNILLYSTIAGAVVNIALLYATINIFNIYAVPISLVLGYCVNVAMRMISINFSVKIKFNLTHIFMNLLFLAIASLVVYLDLNIIVKLIVIIICAVYFIVAYKNQAKSILRTFKKES